MFIRGVAVWTGGEPPRCEGVDSRLLRGTSEVTRVAVDVALRAASQAGVDVARCASVFGSALGELQIAIEQLDMLRTGDGIISPFHFKNSVHNTASGVFSIAARNEGLTTALAAGDHTVAAVLIEALGMLEDGVDDVVAVVADSAPPDPYARELAFETAGVGLVLSRTAGSDAIGEILELAPVARGDRAVLPPSLAQNPAAPALALAGKLARGESGWLVLSDDPAQRWSVELSARLQRAQRVD